MCHLVLIMIVMLAATPAAFAEAPRGLQDLQGVSHRIDEWRGSWVLLKFGTTTCPSCTQQMEEIAAVSQQIGELGVEVLDIYLLEERHTVRKYWAKKGFAYRPAILCAPRGPAASGVVREYGISIIPHLLLIDPAGTRVWQGSFLPGLKLTEVLRREITVHTEGRLGTGQVDSP